MYIVAVTMSSHLISSLSVLHCVSRKVSTKVYKNASVIIKNSEWNTFSVDTHLILCCNRNCVLLRAPCLITFNYYKVHSVIHVTLIERLKLIQHF